MARSRRPPTLRQREDAARRFTMQHAKRTEDQNTREAAPIGRLPAARVGIFVQTARGTIGVAPGEARIIPRVTRPGRR